MIATGGGVGVVGSTEITVFRLLYFKVDKAFKLKS